MHRGGKGIQVEGTACTKACGEEVAQSGGISGSQSSGASEAFEGSATPPPAACAPGLCSDSGHGSQMGLAARGAGCLQQALPPATTHQPSPWLAGTASPGSPHSTQLAAPALVQPRFLPLPLSLLPPAVSLAEFVPFRIAAPTSKELRTD